MSLARFSLLTVTNKTEIPQYQQDYAVNNENLANDIAARPYTPYQGPRIADFSPLQNSGFAAVGTNATGAPLSSSYDNGIATAAKGTTSNYGATLNPGAVA